MSDKSSPSEDLSEPTEEETGDSTEEDLSEHTEKTDAKDPDWVPSKYFKALLTPKTTSFLSKCIESDICTKVASAISASANNVPCYSVNAVCDEKSLLCDE